MNRKQRRQQERIKNTTKKVGYRGNGQIESFDSATFSGVPLVTMCQSIQLLINEMQDRGFPIYDFDHKTKSLRQIQIIGEKVYFLAAEEVNVDE